MLPINLAGWIDEHRHLLRPPVGNQVVWRDSEFIVMVIGGPNARKDFHVDVSEEFFYQVEGDITLRVLENGAFRDIAIKQGEIFLLPPNVPHSPQRPPNTVGLVIERARKPHEEDEFRWYCEDCSTELHRIRLHVTDITTQLAPAFDAFYADAALHTCKRCGKAQQRATL